EIVDHQHIVGLDGIAVVLVRPMGFVVVVGEVDYPDRVGLGRVAHPDPKELVLLSKRVAPHAHAVGNVALPRYRDAPAAAVEGKAVITALNAARHYLAQRQGRRAVAAAVDERGWSAVVVPEQNDRLVADA